MNLPTTLSVAFLTISGLALASPQGDFQPGDVVVVSTSLGGGPVNNPGILRVDGYTGTTQLITNLPLTGRGAAYDRFRGGIVVASSISGPIPYSGLVLAKADGTVTSLNVSTSTSGITSAGDGRIYWNFFDGSKARVKYIDSSNVVHEVLDATGTGPVVLPGTFLGNIPIHVIYDADTNSLFMSQTGHGTPCGDPGGSYGIIFKVPLNAAGSQVGGPITGTTICVNDSSPFWGVNGLAQGPAGKLLVTLNNTSGGKPRLAYIDKTTMAASLFATSTSGPMDAGCYSHLMERGVTLDSFNDKLKLYNQGESSAGTTWVNGQVSSAGGSSEITYVLEIPNDTVPGLAAYGTGTPGCAGALALFATGSPVVGAPNFRFTCSNAPASTLGLLLIGDVPDIAGSDPFGLGALLQIDFFASTFVNTMDLNSNAFGAAESPFAIPLSASLLGMTFDTQALWVFGCPTPSPYGIATSNGLAVTIQ